MLMYFFIVDDHLIKCIKPLVNLNLIFYTKMFIYYNNLYIVCIIYFFDKCHFNSFNNVLIMMLED